MLWLSSLVLLVLVLVLCVSLVHGLHLKHRQPDKPLLTCMFDALLHPLLALHLAPLSHISPSSHTPINIHTYIRKAMDKSRLSDFGSDASFMDRYALVLKHIRAHGGRWSPSGAVYADIYLVNTFVRKLKQIQFLKDHPDVLQCPCERPVFVIGLPRTGTTLLHRLISSHPELRCHYTWEQLEPIPFTKSSDVKELMKDREMRYKTAVNRISLMRLVAGEFFNRIHEIGADEPEECTVLMAGDLPWLVFTLPVVPFVEEELTKLGAGEAYTHYKRILQILSWQIGERSSARRWMLKCPFHPHYIAQLADAFPDATIVWTHRDPLQCVVSACSLYEACAKMAFEHDTIDKQAIGQATLDFSVKQVTRMAEGLEKTRLPVIHVQYEELVQDPKSEVIRVSKALGHSINAVFENEIDDWLEINRQKRASMKGRKEHLHRYTAEEYGLTKLQIREAMNSYITK